MLVLISGASGAGCLLLTLLIRMYTLNQVHDRHIREKEEKKRGDLEISFKFRRSRTFEASAVEDGAIGLAFV